MPENFGTDLWKKQPEILQKEKQSKKALSQEALSQEALSQEALSQEALSKKTLSQEALNQETGDKSQEERVQAADSLFEGLECSIELHPDDALTGLQFRDCLIDYIHCPNRRCIKKMV